MPNNDNLSKTVRLQRIENKLKTGGKLSGPEMEYLRANSPDMYKDAMKIEREREEYRRALEQCRTKEEAHFVHTIRTQHFVAAAKAAPNDSSIPLRIAATFNEFIDFLKSEKYSSLPRERQLREEKIKAFPPYTS